MKTHQKYKFRNAVFILMIFSVIILSGCSNSAQLHQKLVIQGIGIDLKDSQYKITIQALDFKNPSGESEPSIKIMELSGSTISDALENISKQSGLIPLYSQNVIVIMGQSAAKAGVNNFIDFFIRYNETRPNVKICVSNTTAKDILTCESDNGPIQAKSINDLIPSALGSDILHFVGRVQSENSDAYCGILKIDDNDGKKLISFDGLAIFSDDKMVDSLVNKDFLGALVCLGVKNSSAYSMDIENIGRVSLDINKIKSRTQVEVNNTQKEFIVNIDIDSNILEVDRSHSIKIGEDEQNQIERQFADEISEICRQTISKTVSSKSDIFRFGRVVMKNFPSYYKEVNLDLKNVIKSFTYTVNVKSKISITGTEI